ncbi:MAG: hypothetical protein ACQEVA_05655 [Myxococcota bacterium]
MALCAGLVHCDTFSSCGASDPTSEAEATGDVHWVRDTDAVAMAPVTARTVVVAASLDSLLRTGEVAAKSVPSAAPRAMARAFEQTFGWSIWSASGWRSWGVDPGGAIAVFYDRGWWAVSTTVDNSKAFAKIREGWIADEAIDAAAATTGEFEGVNRQLAGRRLHVASDGKVLLAALKVRESPSDAAARDGFPDAWLPGETAFVERLRYRDLFVESLEFGEPAGIVRPAAWMSGAEASGQEKVLIERIASQIGPVAFAVKIGDDDRSVRLEVRTPGEKGAPRAVTDLGEAGGVLPPVGGFIEPGVLGVARVSAAPSALYQLFSSGLSAERRTEFAEFWRRLDRELRIDARSNVLENVQGHALVAVYGVKTEALEAAGDDWINSVVRLNATREAILVPIKDRQKMRRVLDALTTVTKGNLQRQAVGEMIQYAFFKDGELEWAFILGDNHVLYVDSAVAFDQAMQYERSAHPMGESMVETGIDSLIEPTQVSGFYLDAENLGNLLTEAQNKRGARLLGPLRRVLMTTRMEDGVGVTDIRLDLASPDEPSGEQSAVDDTPDETDESEEDPKAPPSDGGTR